VGVGSRPASYGELNASGQQQARPEKQDDQPADPAQGTDPTLVGGY
jgi:hypothetical protein